jgi:hypothetical protein
LDREAIDKGTDLAEVGVEESDDAKAALLESAVAEQRPSQVSHTSHGHKPVAVNAKDSTNGVDQFAYGIADARLAQVAEVSEILANLCIRDSEGLPQLSTGDFLDSLAQKEFEPAQIQTESADAGPRRPGVMSCAALWRFFACAHVSILVVLSAHSGYWTYDHDEKKTVPG